MCSDVIGNRSSLGRCAHATQRLFMPSRKSSGVFPNRFTRRCWEIVTQAPTTNTYSATTSPRRRIRLLRLLPGHGSDGVHCELSTVSLDEANEFEALSYVWGSEANPVQIILSRQTKDVTRSLGPALHHLRNDEKGRILWVDAICINQGDLDERSSQVQLMQRIYSGGSQIVVWLGSLKDGDEQIIEVIRTLGRDSTVHWAAIPKMDAEPFSLYRFLRHPWWSRIWTVQEVALTKQLVYYCGKIHLLSHDLAGVAASYRAHVDTIRCCKGLGPLYYDQVLAAATNMTTLTQNILQLRQFQPRTRNANFNEAKMYELATRDSISHAQNLDILSNTSRCPGGGDAPSWVPDWAAEDHEAGSDLELIRYRAPFLAHYNARGMPPYEPTKGDTAAGTFRLSGVCCDAIERFSESIRLQSFFSEEDTKEPGKAYVAGDTVAEALWRTLCLDVYTCAVLSEDEARPIRRAGAEERDAHLLYWHTRLYKKRMVIFAKGEAALQKRASEFNEHVSKATARRRFFISRKGYMGLGPLESEVDDRICVLAGGRAPFIVRAAQQKEDEASSRIHGLMDGEAMKLVDDGVLRVEDFELV
ncbi:HET-domain-containing protein [Xylaria grammica]|nr:HET-domain-containing protein [Xylaria grammica]